VTDVEISGWQPDWRPAADQLHNHAERLQALRGRQITNGWIVWDLEHDVWFADLPVVLRFDDNRQLEVSWQKFDDLSLTWNTIDVATAPNAWVTWPLEWRRDAHPVLTPVVGDVVNSIFSTEHVFTTRQVLPAQETATTRSTWLVSGIWLETRTAGLHIFNALDENGLGSTCPEPGPEFRRTPL